MKRKIEVTVGDLSGRGSIRAGVAARRGRNLPKRRGTVDVREPARVAQESNAGALELLEAVKRSGPMSANELARLLGRNYKNVHTDVTRPRRTGVDRKVCRSTYRGGMGHDHGRDEAGRMSGRSVAMLSPATISTVSSRSE